MLNSLTYPLQWLKMLQYPESHILFLKCDVYLWTVISLTKIRRRVSYANSMVWNGIDLLGLKEHVLHNHIYIIYIRCILQYIFKCFTLLFCVWKYTKSHKIHHICGDLICTKWKLKNCSKKKLHQLLATAEIKMLLKLFL